MKTRPLGRSNIDVSAVGLGCWAIGGESWRDGKPCGWSGANDDESIRAIHKALDLGATFLDTADVYGCGHSERLIAKAIEGHRDELVIASKFGFPIDEETRTTSGARCDREYILAACEASLRRLKTDYIDLYQFHLGKSDKGEEVRETLEELVESGKIRYYGWSTDSPENVPLFAKGDHCTAIQQALNVFGGSFDTLRECEKHNLASIIRGPLGKGLLTGKFSHDTTFPENDVRHNWDMSDKGAQAEALKKVGLLRDILTADGRTPAQGAICWLWAISPATIPIPGFKTVAQVEDNLGAMNHDPLTSDQLQEIDRLLGRESVG